MLKSLFGKRADAALSAHSAHASSGKLDPGRMRTLIEFFPIGKKLRYYPEFNKDIVLDTLVIGYGVNHHFIYSMDSIETDPDGTPVSFHAEDTGVRIPVAGIRQFQILVPDTSDLEKKLDYQRRAQLSRHGQFSPGNSISLISNAGMKGISTVDTEVARQVVLRDGPYAQMNMVLLTPELGTLSVTDQRRKPRTRTSVPATLCVPGAEFSGGCTIVDVSEAELRLRLDGGNPAMPPLQKGDPLLIDIRLGATERHYSVKGSIIRSSAGTCVVRLDGQIRERRLEPFAPLDLLELKACLLNYGKEAARR
ncbi:PilZ domain-containing protein [Propionivibrio sp.]|uniref:PilZ domain-containing protein n=1 Tax=Propionivibrio sp. TaxID=2212460 RepID=UPI00272E8E70|nr:PilZ domain-containing protein [Propionivibrio sp.]